MELPQQENKSPGKGNGTRVSTSSSNQQFIPDNLDLPDDTFRMSLDDFSVIGENVTIGERIVSVDSIGVPLDTPVVSLPTPSVEIPETPLTPPTESPPITETPTLSDQRPTDPRKPPNLLKLSLKKNSEGDVFVKPSPVMEIMSPAKMLQFEVDTATSSTPTMKRAAIDFDFFTKNNFEEFFKDVPAAVNTVKKEDESAEESQEGNTFEETPVIVKADTVRHDIGYSKFTYLLFVTSFVIYECKGGSL